MNTPNPTTETSKKFNGRLIRNKTAKCEICGRVPSSKTGNEMYNYRYYLGDNKFACIPCARQQELIPSGMSNYAIENIILK